MTAETISSACFALLVVVFCCVIKIYTVVKSIPLSRNERVRVVYARDNQRALPVAREPTVYFLKLSDEHLPSREAARKTDDF